MNTINSIKDYRDLLPRDSAAWMERCEVKTNLFLNSIGNVDLKQRMKKIFDGVEFLLSDRSRTLLSSEDAFKFFKSEVETEQYLSRLYIKEPIAENQKSVINHLFWATLIWATIMRTPIDETNPYSQENFNAFKARVSENAYFFHLFPEEIEGLFIFEQATLELFKLKKLEQGFILRVGSLMETATHLSMRQVMPRLELIQELKDIYYPDERTPVRQKRRKRDFDETQEILNASKDRQQHYADEIQKISKRFKDMENTKG